MANHSSDKPGSVIYFSHGGGPLPILGDPSHEKMVGFLKKLPSTFPRPDKILVISAHWEETLPTVIGNESPPLLYDYYGFPKESYELKYPVQGSPDLSESVQTVLRNNGIQSLMTEERGFDHGLFIPLKIMYPGAKIPTTQLSLVKGLHPQVHLDLGRALRPLSKKNLLIIGSGFSFHNMGMFSWDTGNGKDSANDEFQNWLVDVCSGSHSLLQREEMLLHWFRAPHARYCHPREEHLLPLHVCFGIAGGGADVIFDDYILGKRAVAFKW